MIRLGVLGWPVAHSRSPAIQNAALAAAGLSDWRYQLLPVPPDLLTEVVAALPAAGFRGVNVTIPHKQAALALATEPTRREQTTLPSVIAIPGGVPIRVGDDVIGGVGVSGSPGVDEPCVMAGLDKVREQLK